MKGQDSWKGSQEDRIMLPLIVFSFNSTIWAKVKEGEEGSGG